MLPIKQAYNSFLDQNSVCFLQEFINEVFMKTNFSYVYKF